MKKSDPAVVTIIYAICLFFFVMTLQLPAEAQTYPLCLIAGLFVLNSIYTARAALSWFRTHTVEDDVKESFGGFQLRQFLTCVGLGLLYMVLLWLIGFYISTVLYLVGTMLYLSVPKLHIAITTAVMLGVVYAVFTMFLKVPLPVGELFR